MRLLDEHGVQQGAQQVHLPDFSPALWTGLSDTRRYIFLHQGNLLLDGWTRPATAAELLEHLGVFLGEQVLGSAIMQVLTQTAQRRTLLVHLPPTADDVLAAAFARVPWEIARPGVGQPPLLERNLIVRLVTEDTAQRDDAVAAVAQRVAQGEILRVLLVFAEAPGSRPLAMRLEREQLLTLFYDKILPQHPVQIDVLCHGVTRALLREQIEAAGGYHIVHWSGHGHHNLLELRGLDGQAELLAGEQLVELFIQAGGFIPQLVFLSACLSGTFVSVHDWETLRALVAGEDVSAKRGEEQPLPELLTQASGYTGTALALLRSGVPQVIAMRYEVGDDYARELARVFYQRLLADPARRPTDDALALARTDLWRDQQARQFAPVDHATPLLFGQPGRLLEPVRQRSAQLARRWPRPQPLLPSRKELDRPLNFVGRGEELTRLHNEWLSDTGPAVALVQGLAGLGKTALAAETIHLWHPRFDYVLAFQAKPIPLTVDGFYQQVDARLTLASQPYRDRCENNPYSKVFLPPGQPLTGEARYEHLRTNLFEALRDEAILLVLDNFETVLETLPGKQGYACADPQWDRLLQLLVQELPGTRSRLLLTSRHRPTALADALWISLGPLPMGEAALYIRSHPALNTLWFADAAGRQLVERLLALSRGHPLIMERLAALAGDRKALTQALERLKAEGMKTLPDLFTEHVSEADRERERRYLEDVAVGSIDLLLERLSPDARRLLWMVTLANEPVTEELIAWVWFERSVGNEELTSLRKLLAELHQAGLLSCEPTVPADKEAPYSFHELVRERSAAWIQQHPAEMAGRTIEQVWIAYGERYAAMFKEVLQSGRERAREVAAELGRRGLVYLLRARAFDRLGGFASMLVTSTHDPILLRGVIAELQAVVEQVPAGREHWYLCTTLADALRLSGYSDQALSWYEQGAAEAEAAGHWADVGWITCNWALALHAVGHLDAAKAMQLRSAEAEQKADRRRVNVLMSELETLRIDVMHGQVEQALPDIDARLAEVRGWWQRYRAGETVPEAPNAELLGRALVSGLDIAMQANQSLKRWQDCLDLLGETEQIKRTLGESRHARAKTQFDRYFPLLMLGRLDEAQQLLEDCLGVFQEADDLTHQSKVLSALADLWDRRGDLDQALALQRQALAVCNRLSNPVDRAISHNNLSTYLDRANRLVDMARHQLAAFVYLIVVGHHEYLKDYSLCNLASDMHRAAQTGQRYELPPLAELLALPEFDALRQFLVQREVDLADLQAVIDEQVEAVRRQV
ncbi:MAG: CHAT domain-containing protein [Candidatus Competibacteraceae bacterium]